MFKLGQRKPEKMKQKMSNYGTVKLIILKNGEKKNFRRIQDVNIDQLVTDVFVPSRSGITAKLKHTIDLNLQFSLISESTQFH